jgi:putative tryptophan/tyrosine transport system substrate-binding protein
MGVGQTNRRAFIVGLRGLAAGPFCVRAQKTGPVRHVAVLLPLREGEGIGKPGVAVFQQALQKLGWGLGRNLRISVHYAGPDREGTRAGAAELVRMMPDIILTMASPATAAVLAQTRTIPIVFVHVSDPVTGGLVDSLAHPGANATGFTNLDPSLGGKWAELLKEIAPSVKRAALMFNSEALPQAEYFVRAFEAATRWLVIEPSTPLVRDDVDIEARYRGPGPRPERRSGRAAGCPNLRTSGGDQPVDGSLSSASRQWIPDNDRGRGPRGVCGRWARSVSPWRNVC